VILEDDPDPYVGTDTRDMGLRRYHAKRDFRKTPEPRGAEAPASNAGGKFVVQKHDATRLHYDFRLEMEGVLKSWAIPKGPSLDPADKRLAVHVEDHPVDYADFEGVIPEGEYGGGPVIVWDRGRWTPVEGDGLEAYRKGRLKFRLAGKKLHGTWNLVRMHTGDGDRNWLLVKDRDAHAVRGKAPVVERLPKSVVTDRPIEALSPDKEPVWRSNRATKPSSSRGRRPRLAARAAKPAAGPAAGAGDFVLTNPDRVLWPDVGLTKKDLAEHYARVAQRMLPFAAGRPLMLLRCPEGTKRGCFVQKHVDGPLPRGLVGVPIREKGETARYLAVEDEAGLLSLAQLGALEVHGWGSRAGALETPDHVVFDLDPAPDVPFRRVVEACLEVRKRLRKAGLASFPSTTGGKGLHVHVPLSGKDGWDEVKAFCRALAERLAADEPERYLSKASKAARAGKIFVDWLRNGRGATAVLPYSPRAREVAPVATPLAWSEVKPALDPKAFTITTFPRRLRRADPWRGYLATRQRLP
jgi:bifunctional non-homologous end joining protein LigD